jgi:hypothetical protein
MAEVENKIPNGVAADLVKYINADKKASGASKKTEVEKDEFFTSMKDKISEFVFADDFTITKDTLKKYDQIEAEAYQGLQEGLLTRVQKDALLKDARQAVNDGIDSNNVEYNTMASMPKGIQYPIAYANKNLKDRIGVSPSKQRAVMSKFADLLGKVDKDGNILSEGEYKSTGNDTQDQEIIDRAMNKAIQLYNKGINPAAVKAKANAVVAPVPKAGDIKGGFRFKGGDPSNQKNWEKVE